MASVCADCGRPKKTTVGPRCRSCASIFRFKDQAERDKMGRPGQPKPDGFGARLSKSIQGHAVTQNTRDAVGNIWRDKHLSESHKANLSKSFAGKPKPWASENIQRVRRAGSTKESSLEKTVRLFLEEIGEPHVQEEIIKGMRGNVDFYLPRLNAVIECDGYYHYTSDKQKTQDLRRNNKLFVLGIPLLRIPGGDIKKDWPGVMARILKFIGKEA